MEHLIQHFRKEEQPFIEQVISWQREVEDRYAPKLTDFLDPRQRFIVTSIIGQDDTLKTACTGLFDGAERQRMLIFLLTMKRQKKTFSWWHLRFNIL